MFGSGLRLVRGCVCKSWHVGFEAEDGRKGEGGRREEGGGAGLGRCKKEKERKKEK